MSSRRRNRPESPESVPAPKPVTLVPRPLILVTAFISGMAVMVLELIGSRVIGPFYGVSLYVWASLIATALVALSLGYWLGGRLADRKATGDSLYVGVLIAAALTCALPLLRRPVLHLAAPLGVRMGSLTSAILLFLPPIACLGIVAPYAVKLHARSLASVGASAGVLSAVSTLGSVLGTLMTGFVLIPAFPMDHIIIGLGVMLACLSLAYWIIRPRGAAVAASLAVLAAAMTVAGTGGDDNARLARTGVRVLHARETPYGRLKVMDSGGIRYLLVNGSFQGEVDLATGRSSAPYIHLLAAVCGQYAPAARSVLCVGLGAGTLPALVQQGGTSVDAVEIDHAVVDAAKRYFGFVQAEGRTFTEDGRRFLATDGLSYDAILLDAFASEAIPEHLLTVEAFHDCARRVSDQGLVAINLVGFVDGPHSRVPRAVFRTMAAVFPHAAAWFIPQDASASPFGSIILVGSKLPLPETSLAPVMRATAGDMEWIDTVIDLEWEGSGPGTILTDQHNPIAAWNA
ncbi:MAG: fused MFS/spermidine synthase, partial [Candidatus Eisenbacteria bacterium]|nr:fused MFS/spermidine synthase [Candidatus Eisenbacteria bacterium]